MGVIDNFEKMLSSGQDNALLRYSLGNAYYNEKQYEAAVAHLQKALEFDPQYSAAWKIYGRTLVELGKTAAAKEAFEQGIQIAEKKGDKQAAKEMGVFLKRIVKAN